MVMAEYRTAIRGLHHAAFRCLDSEETRRFYEEFLELRLAGALEIRSTKTGRDTNVLHTFYELDDGAYLAFFEAPDSPFEFKPQHDFDLHMALEVDEPEMMRLFEKAQARGIERRGVADHGFIHSVYFRDPNGYVVELSARQPNHAEEMDPARNGARSILDAWQAAKQA
jgi:catechol 2,3-dioxygenase-like lactoylglutathione lyase family enzyme